MTRAEQRRARAQREADRWNRRYVEGIPVRYWTGVREGEGAAGETRSQAWAVGDHASVWVTGVAGCVALTHVEPHPATGALAERVKAASMALQVVCSHLRFDLRRGRLVLVGRIRLEEIVQAVVVRDGLRLGTAYHLLGMGGTYAGVAVQLARFIREETRRPLDWFERCLGPVAGGTISEMVRAAGYANPQKTGCVACGSAADRGQDDPLVGPRDWWTPPPRVGPICYGEACMERAREMSRGMRRTR